MSESSLSESDAAIKEAEAIFKETKFLNEVKLLLEENKSGLLEAFKKANHANRDMAACIATAQTLSKQMPEVANRLHIYELLTYKTDPAEKTVIPKIHNVLGFEGDEGQPVKIIDPSFIQYEIDTPYLIGSRDEVLPKYTEPNDPRKVIPVRVAAPDIVDFMDRNQTSINVFAKALQKKAA